ncbi:hypothetical protein B0J11DRAFT_442374 [Dendryphion nanum]|uniref:Glycine zipper 2TM domain-containing protein n=1 Tax=Dendryphion nanum TaxID=256645 RepID=A0A9P9ICS0_9PLEO|nr:hypothetical protein B0J11DRAFT_442374 [Dendryphion nanum]
MAALALKAIDYGAEKIPDKFFESIPGGFFTPQEKKEIRDRNRDRNRDRRHRSEQRQNDRDRRRSQRDRTPPTDYSDHSGYDDTDYEREREHRDKQQRHRAKSAGGDYTHTKSQNRGRHNQRTSDLDGEYGYPDMDRNDRGPEFPPPPASEYRPYNPAEYAPSPVVGPEYSYSSQVNNYDSRPRSHSATVPATRSPLIRAQSIANSPMFRSRSVTAPWTHPLSAPPIPSTPYNTFFPPYYPSTLNALSYRSSPLSASFIPSYEPPLAALLQASNTNSPQPQGSYPQPAPSTAAARYTPANAYTHSPVNANAPIPPSSPYPPYNPADYTAPGNAYASPPPFYRQQSRSQPSLAEYPPPENTLTYNEPPSQLGSTSSSRHHRHGDGKQHRARSADHHKRSRSRVADKFRDRFDNFDGRERGLAASVGGALAGGLAGRAVGHGTLSTLAGAAIGAFGVREFEKRHEK